MIYMAQEVFTMDTTAEILINYRRNQVESYMNPDRQTAAPHFHYQYELLLCIAGEADFVIAGQLYHIGTGSMLFMSNHENHCIQLYSQGYERYTLRFSTELVELYLRDPLLLSIFKQRPHGFSHLYQCTPQELKHYLALIRLMDQEYQNQKPYWTQMISAKLMTILISMFRMHPECFPGSRSTENQGLIFNIQNYIEMNPGADLRLDTVASKFYVSKFHLSHCFPQITGYSYKDFIIITRIAKAKDLLLRTQDDVSVIGKAVGFQNASNFIRTFKAREGVSPLQYRKAARST